MQHATVSHTKDQIIANNIAQHAAATAAAANSSNGSASNNNNRNRDRDPPARVDVPSSAQTTQQPKLSTMTIKDAAPAVEALNQGGLRIRFNGPACTYCSLINTYWVKPEVRDTARWDYPNGEWLLRYTFVPEPLICRRCGAPLKDSLPEGAAVVESQSKNASTKKGGEHQGSDMWKTLRDQVILDNDK